LTAYRITTHWLARRSGPYHCWW